MIRLTWRERMAALVFGQLPARRARHDGLPEATGASAGAYV